MRLYIQNIPYDCELSELKEWLDNIAAVHDVILATDHDGISKGFGFCSVEPAEFEAAIAAIDGKRLRGRKLKCVEANPPKPYVKSITCNHHEG